MGTISCTKCYETISDAHSTCPYCGQGRISKFSTKKPFQQNCRNCGATLKINAGFCPSCGKSFKSTGQIETDALLIPPTLGQASSGERPPITDRNESNPVYEGTGTNPDVLGCPKCGHPELERIEVYKWGIGFGIVLIMAFPILLGIESEGGRKMIGFGIMSATLFVYYNWKRQCYKCGYTTGHFQKIRDVVFHQSDFIHGPWRKKHEAQEMKKEAQRNEGKDQSTNS